MKLHDESNDIDQLYGSDIIEEPGIFILFLWIFILYFSILLVLCVSIITYVTIYQKQWEVILAQYVMYYLSSPFFR